MRLQCYRAQEGRKNLLFAGLQWLPTRSLSPGLRARIEAVMLQLGVALHGRRFVGTANVDFMVEGEDVLLLECNPRLSAATPQLLRHRELMAPNAGDLLLSCYVSPPPRVSSAPQNGRYTVDGATRLSAGVAWDGRPDLVLITLAQPGEVLGPEETLGSVSSAVRLYDDSGNFLPVTSVISNNFMFKYLK